MTFRSGHSSFGPRAGVTFRSGPAFGSGFRLGTGASFGHNPRFNVFVGSRPFGHARRWSTYPYRYSPSYVYPYVAYPAYPLSYYDAYDYVPVQPSYLYGYAAGGDNYPDVGLAQQMRQQKVGVYAQQPDQQSYVTNSQAAANARRVEPEAERPATVLIYRDGQRAEVRNYAVVGQTLWIFSEDRSQKVPLAQLDLEATRKANDERGIEFPPVR